jgi:CRP/FNR family cyclic AMP-dependent transcriptional regulator
MLRLTYRGPVPTLLRILEEDPDLGCRVQPEDRLEAARRACLAESITVTRGAWRPGPESEPARRGFGLLVVRGLLTRRVGRDGRFGAELLGPGDLLRPWDRPGAVSIMPFSTEWKVIQPLAAALLGRRFAGRAGRDRVAGE